MIVKIKKSNASAQLPTRAHETDAGYDLYAVTKEYDDDGNIVYGTGLAFEIPKGHVGLLFPRSSNAKKHLLLSNSVGVVDSGYRGEVTFKFKIGYYDFMHGSFYHCKNKEYEIGDRIGQIIILPYPDVEFAETDTLTETERGEGGYGSSGK